MTPEEAIRNITDRIAAMKTRLEEQRENEPDLRAIGRTEGNIGALEWVLRELTPSTTRSGRSENGKEKVASVKDDDARTRPVNTDLLR